MMKFYHFNFKKMAALAAVAVVAMTGQAQLLRTTYFMEGAQYRMQLNPAMTPSRGYVHLPVVSNFGVSFVSNSLGVQDVSDIIKNADDADYFTSDSFMNRLSDDNRATINMGTDLIAAGWWHGKSFMSINVGVKLDAGLRAPRELFEFMRDMRAMEEIDYTNYNRNIGHEEVNLTAYTEIGFGYTRQINDRLSIGGRVKGLLGLGNARLKVNEAVVKTRLEGLDPDYDWVHGDPAELLSAHGTASIDVDAVLESSFEGLELMTNDKTYIDDVKFKSSKMGIAGFGAAFDLGFSYRVVGGLTLSAAVNDLGFIHWSKGCTTIARAQTQDLHFDSDNPGDLERFQDIISQEAPINGDILRMTIDEGAAKARNTNITSTIVAGADYAFNGDKVRVGALFTRRNDPIKAQDELTLSANLHPSSLVDLAVSYSPIACGGQSVGLAVKVGPLFLGTDYIYTGKNTKCCNALAGISIPLGKKPKGN